MNCSKCEELMSDYLEGAAVPAQRQAIEYGVRLKRKRREPIPAGIISTMK